MSWSSVRDYPTIAHSIHNWLKFYLISTTDPGSNMKTGGYYAQSAKDHISYLGNKY